MSLKDLKNHIRAMKVIDYILEDVVKNHPHIFVNAIVRYVDEHPEILEEAKIIMEKQQNAEVQKEDNPPDGL